MLDKTIILSDYRTILRSYYTDWDWCMADGDELADAISLLSERDFDDIHWQGTDHAVVSPPESPH